MNDEGDPSAANGLPATITQQSVLDIAERVARTLSSPTAILDHTPTGGSAAWHVRLRGRLPQTESYPDERSAGVD